MTQPMQSAPGTDPYIVRDHVNVSLRKIAWKAERDMRDPPHQALTQCPGP
jgi:hypothetical protein